MACYRIRSKPPNTAASPEATAAGGGSMVDEESGTAVRQGSILGKVGAEMIRTPVEIESTSPVSRALYRTID